MSPSKILIFDFDGTIADTYRSMVEISNRLAQRFKYRTIEPHEYDTIKDKSSIEIIKHLKISTLKIPAIIANAKRELNKNLSNIPPIDGIHSVLQTLIDQHVRIGILSSNSSKNIQKFLTSHQMDFFHFIHPTSKIWSKNTSLKALIEKYRFNKENVIYVGDEIRDVVAAQKLGIKVAAVTWGYNSIEALQKHKPDYLIQHPQELLNIL